MRKLKFAKALGVIVLTVLLFGVIFLFVPFFVLQNHLSDGCEEIESIARDERAVAYLDKWVSDKVLDRGYTFVSGMHGRISATSDGKYLNITPLPKESLSRIPNDYLRFGIETLDGDLDSAVTKANVGQIEIGLGRNQLILLKNGKVLSDYRGHDKKSGHLLQISENIYAYCSDARF